MRDYGEPRDGPYPSGDYMQRALSLAPPQAPEYRAAPANSEAEQALLGAILVNNATHHRVADFLRAEHFYNPPHQRIYAAAVTLIERGQIADPATLKGYFAQDEALAEIGGADYLGRLAASVITIINAGDYGRTIYDCYLRRQLIEIATAAVNEAYDADIDVDGGQLLTSTQDKLGAIALTDAAGSCITLGRAAAEAAQYAGDAFRRGGAGGTPTGLKVWDDSYGGLFGGDSVVIGARPGMGKTALALTIGINVARRSLAEDPARPRRVAMFEREMSARAIGMRYNAAISGIPAGAQRRGDVDMDQITALDDAARSGGSLPFDLITEGNGTAEEICRRAKAMHRRSPLSMVIIDHLTLLETPGGPMARRFGLEDATRRFKLLAKNLDIPVITLCQLSRGVEARDDKRPSLADLRETGAIEQDADVVAFIYREEYYLAKAEPARRETESEDAFYARQAAYFGRLAASRGIADLIFAKYREDVTKTLIMRFDGPRQRFGDVGDYG
jgi:replicative DNA helicase